MRPLFIVLLFLISSLNELLAQSQSAIREVADLSVKVPGLSTKEYYYALEAGDELQFDFADQTKKGLKQVEIIEYPGNVKYSGFQVASLTKHLPVNKRSIFLFRFTNNALTPRVCSVKINRKPASAGTLNFPTAVSWKEVPDTLYTTVKRKVIRYDTTFTYATKKELVRVDTIAQELMSRSEQVAAATSLGKPSRSLVLINLPQNKTAPYESTELLSWAYWIGVGQEGHIAFEANKRKYMQVLGSLASANGNPLIGFALNQVAFLPTGNAGSNVGYYFMNDQASASQFLNNFSRKNFSYFEKGNGLSGHGKQEAPLQRAFYLGLHNDNFHNEINVTVKIVTVSVRKSYIAKLYQQPVVTPRYEKKQVKQALVTMKKVPVI